MTTTPSTKTAHDALNDLVDTARARARAAHNQGRKARARSLENIAYTLDRCRTRLVEDGPEYLDAAWAFIDAGRKQLAIFGGLQQHLELAGIERGTR